MNLIQEETKSLLKFSFQKGNPKLLELTRSNVSLVESMICYDSDYHLMGNKEAKPEGKNKGSAAYWMTKLKEDLDNNSQKLKETIREAVLAVDRENSTHITSDSVGHDVLTERIYERRETLIDDLKCREKGFEIIMYLTKKTLDEPIIEKHGKKYHPRENYSFATKFCHYACFYFFEGTEWQDNYSIYDKILCAVLPEYLKAAGIKKKDGSPYKISDFNKVENYPTYSHVIDLLRNDKISRNGFDHLLWYYHKANPLKLNGENLKYR